MNKCSKLTSLLALSLLSIGMVSVFVCNLPIIFSVAISLMVAAILLCGYYHYHQKNAEILSLLKIPQDSIAVVISDCAPLHT
jgi:hypothetical protein